MNKSAKIRVIIAVVLAVTVIGLVGSYAAVKMKSNGDEITTGESTTDSVSVQTVESTAEKTSADNTEAEQTEAEQNKIPTKAPQTTESESASEYAYAYAGFNPKLATMKDGKWYLLLVNRDYILPDDFEVKTAKTVVDIYGGYDRGYLDYRVAPHYIEMYNAALKDGLKLSPLSGYRSVQRQKNNFENLIADYVNKGYSKAQATVMASEIILPPSTSEHNAGLAMDFLSLEVSFENSDEFAWLQENAADYGFILRYPKDKQHITKITYEPWHWRYVGVETAKAMKQSGECLEEYFDIA